MNSRLQPCFKIIFTPFLIATTLLLIGCGSFGTSQSSETAEMIEPLQTDLSVPTIRYLLPENEQDVDSNEPVSASKWLSVAQNYYENKRYARALRAAEASLSSHDSKEARKIAMLSTVNITQQNMNVYENNLNDDEKNMFKDRLTKITTAISKIENSQSQNTTDKD